MKLEYLNDKKIGKEDGKEEKKTKFQKFKDLLQKAKKIVLISGMAVFLTVSLAKCGDAVVEPPVIEVKDASQDAKIKDVQQDGEVADAADAKDAEVKDDGQTGEDVVVKDVQQDGEIIDIADAGQDAEIKDGQTGEDVVSGDVISDGGGEDGGVVTPCEKIEKDLDRNDIKFTYRYSTRDNIPLKCEEDVKNIYKIVVTFAYLKYDENNKEYLQDLTIPQAEQGGINICFPKMEMCTYENNGDDFPKGGKLQIQRIDPKQNIIKFVVSHIAAYLDTINPIYQNYTYIEDAAYGVVGPGRDNEATYLAFADRYTDMNNLIVIKNGQILCGNERKCGKQYRVLCTDENGKGHISYVTSIHVKGIRGAMDGGVLTTYPLYDCKENCDEKNIKISNYEWKVTVTMGKNENNEDVVKAIAFTKN